MNCAIKVLLVGIAFLLVPYTEQIEGGRDQVEGELPWQVIIFGSKHDQNRMCGGTVITYRFVLTAEICVMNYEAGDFVVEHFKVGNEYSTNVSKIHKYGSSEGLEEPLTNVVLLELEGSLIRASPVCIEQVGDLTGLLGFVPGWEKGVRNPGLKVAQLPVASTADCLKSASKLRVYLRERTTICAGYLDDPVGICHSDVGEGLAFERADGRWFLGAVALFRLHRSWPEERSCSKRNDYSVFINLHDFVPWISNVTNLESLSGECGKTLVSSKDYENLCGITKHRLDIPNADGQKADPSNWPWYVAVYHRKNPKYACGGTLISKRIVMTAQVCTLANGGGGPQLSVDEISCQLGIGEGVFDEHGSQTYSVRAIYHSPKRNNMQTDLVLLQLHTEVNLTEQVLPVCLPEPKIWDEFVIGVASTEEPVNRIQVVIQRPPVRYGKQFEISEPYHSAVRLVPGSGFVYPFKGTWMLFGVGQRTVKSSKSQQHYVIFTEVKEFLTWIKYIVEEMSEI